MFTARVDINGLDETATRPMVTAIGQDIKQFLGIGKDVHMSIGDDPQLELHKDVNGKITHTPDILDEELYLSYTEHTTDDYTVALHSTAAVNGYVYLDKEIRAWVAPMLSRRTLNINTKYYSKSKSMVSRLVNKLSMLPATEGRQRYHDLEYFYYFPDEITMLLDTINNLKNTYLITKLDLDQYIANTFSQRASVVGSESGITELNKLVIREKQLGVLGTIDTDVYTIRMEKDDDTNRWYIELEYSLEYDLPVQLLTTYPIAIYNQPIPSEYMPQRKSLPRTSAAHTTGEEGLARLGTKDTSILSIPESSYYINIPPEDNLVLPKPESYYVRIFSVFSIVDHADPTMLFYLDEIPHITIKKDVLELLQLEAPRVGDPHRSMFYFDIYNFERRDYRYKVIMTPEAVVVKGVTRYRLKLTTNIPLDIRGNYRVAFNILSDIAVIPSRDLTTLKSNIDTVDKQSINGFSVVDTVMGVLNLDTTTISLDLNSARNITSFDIAMNVKNTLWNRVFTKQVSLVLTSMLEPK